METVDLVFLKNLFLEPIRTVTALMYYRKTSFILVLDEVVSYYLFVVSIAFKTATNRVQLDLKTFISMCSLSDLIGHQVKD